MASRRRVSSRGWGLRSPGSAPSLGAILAPGAGQALELGCALRDPLLVGDQQPPGRASTAGPPDGSRGLQLAQLGEHLVVADAGVLGDRARAETRPSVGEHPVQLSGRQRRARPVAAGPCRGGTPTRLRDIGLGTRRRCLAARGRRRGTSGAGGHGRWLGGLRGWAPSPLRARAGLAWAPPARLSASVPTARCARPGACGSGQRVGQGACRSTPPAQECQPCPSEYETRATADRCSPGPRRPQGASHGSRPEHGPHDSMSDPGAAHAALTGVDGAARRYGTSAPPSGPARCRRPTGSPAAERVANAMVIPPLSIHAAVPAGPRETVRPVITQSASETIGSADRCRAAVVGRRPLPSRSRLSKSSSANRSRPRRSIRCCCERRRSRAGRR